MPPSAPPFANLLLLLLVAFIPNVHSTISSTARECPSPVFRPQRWTMNSSYALPLQQTPFHFYALTQDCQFVIARPDQLNKLTSLRIDRRSRECHPSRVQLLWSLASAQPGLLLLHKRSAHELCLLPVEMPIPLVVYGPQLFSYSLRSALSRFAKCSKPQNPESNRFSPHLLPAEPQLAFADSLYADLFYQLAPSNSTFGNWTLHQLQLSSWGHLHGVEQFKVHPMGNKKASAELLLTTDAQRKRLFTVPKKLDDAAEVEWTCPFDLIFRPSQTKFHRFPLFPKTKDSQKSKSSGSRESPSHSLLTSFSVDRHVAIFTVEHLGQTELFLAKLNPKGGVPESRCVLRMGFAATFGVISAETLKELANKVPLPSMGEKLRSSRPRESSAEKAPIKTTSPPKTTKSPKAMPTSTPSKPAWTVSSWKSVKVTPTTQYFWHRTTTVGTTATTSLETTKDTVEEGQIGEEEENWVEDYEDGEEDGKSKDNSERDELEEGILPLPGEEEVPSPGQMVREELASNASGKADNQKAANLAVTPRKTSAVWMAFTSFWIFLRIFA